METINIVAPNAEALKVSIFEMLNKEMLIKLLKRDSEFPLLHIKREDCGCEFSYKTEQDIPSDNVICKHGNKIIYYTNNK